TKEFVKCYNEQQQQQQQQQQEEENSVLVNGASAPSRNRRANRNQAKATTVFRHSVEVSQLLTLWQSDVNSNISDMIMLSLMETNNNNVDDDQLPEVENPEESVNENLIMIPEILIN